MYTAAFLGLAVAGAVAFLAFLTRPGEVDAYAPAASLAETQINRTTAFIRWVNIGVGKRAWALRGSAAAFAIGVAFIPAAFIGATGAGTASTVEAPAIPDQVAPEVKDDAARLFKAQVEAYVASVAADESGEIAATAACKGWTDIAQACGWSSETQIERHFRDLALLGLLIVIIAMCAPPIVVPLLRKSAPTD